MQARKSSNLRANQRAVKDRAGRTAGPARSCPVARVSRTLCRAIIFAMLSQQLPRRIARQAIAWPLPGNNVCILCLSANVFQRHYAKPVPARAPSTRHDQWRNRSRVINDAEKQAMRAALLPKPSFIQYLKEAGLIRAEPSEVMELLGKMRDLGSELNGVIAKKLCSGWLVLYMSTLSSANKRIQTTKSLSTTCPSLRAPASTPETPNQSGSLASHY